jgi:hypothetical protein
MGDVHDLFPDPGPEGTGVGPTVARRRGGAWLLLAVAVLAPVVVALALTPWRERLAAANAALLLVVVIVAVATSGRRWAAALCAVVSALAFDFLLTRPYHSFRISLGTDLTTAILLLVVGLVVGDLAARGRSHRTAANEGRRHVALLHAVNELAAGGEDADAIVQRAADELCRLLDLRTCTFTPDGSGAGGRVEPDGTVWIGGVLWNTADLGLPFRGVDLPIRGDGRTLGHFVLAPVPSAPVDPDLLVVAVAVADQVGAALAVAGSREALRP